MAGQPIEIIITGEEKVVGSFVAIPDLIRARVKQALAGLGIELANRVKATKLSGQVLKVRSGRLRNSINSRVTQAGDVYAATVGTKVVYGRFWELGFSGTESVRAHTRHVAGRDVRGSRPDLKSGRGKIAQGLGFVRAHDRIVHQAPRPFLRPAFNEMRGIARERLTAALGRSS